MEAISVAAGRSETIRESRAAMMISRGGLVSGVAVVLPTVLYSVGNRLAMM
jgi:hypothetical protein